jgi:hypothetical protein
MRNRMKPFPWRHAPFSLRPHNAANRGIMTNNLTAFLLILVFLGVPGVEAQ